MDFISTLYETFSGQTLGRPDKKRKRKLRAQRGVSVAKSPILMSLKSPQKGKVAKKKSARPNLKSITNTSNNNNNNNNKPVPPNKKSSSKNSNNTIDEKKRTSAIQFAIESGEKSTLPSLMRKIETKKRAILVQIEALEKEVRTKKAEVVELEKELLLGASSW